MQIPLASESSSDFSARIATLILREETHLYIDTSFLMWLTKIGRTSRRELIAWLKDNCSGRVHVPIWAAHEYLRHHVAGTIVAELDRVATELADIAARTYANLRPFLDDPLTPESSNSKRQQVNARQALHELQRLAETAKRWNQEYKEHAAEVLSFINEHALEKTLVFEYMSGIEALSTGRFNGRLPPGFQDRKKRGRSKPTVESQAEEVFGDNRWGDLIFWKELLDHAQQASAKALIILTNDRKNDWQLGGRGTEGIEPDLFKLKARWKPVPCAHPMLSFEARITAGVDDVVLLDPPYLGALLRTVAAETAKAFVDVAIIPDPPLGSSEAVRRIALTNALFEARQTEEVEQASITGIRFLDSPRLASAPSAFLRALYDSRQDLNLTGPLGALSNDIGLAISEGTSIADLLVKERLEPLNNSMLTALARDLHDRALANSPGLREAITDLITTLEELPPLTAASLYLGLAASMYLERASNQPILPPQSPIAALLFERQGVSYATPGIAALQNRFAKLDRRPLYLLSSEHSLVDVIIDNVPDTYGEVVLGSLQISGEEVFTRAQGNQALQLSNFFPNRLEVSGEELVVCACEVFTVPFSQVQRNDNFDRKFSFDSTAGFKRPHEVFVESEVA